MMKNVLLLLLSFLSASISVAQIIEIEPSIDPPFFEANEEITITYDVTGTIMHDWQEAWLWMWLPSLSSDAPSNINPASSNPALTDAAKLTKSVVDGKQIFSISLVPANFTGVDAAEIEAIGFLLKGNDWSNGQTTDYIAEVGSAFRIVFENPDGGFGFYEMDDVINVEVITSEAATITLYIDDAVVLENENAEALDFQHTVIADDLVHTITAIGTTDAEADTISHAYTIQPVPPSIPLPADLEAGINYHPDSTSVSLVITAPNKENIFVIGDFNNWSLNSDFLMNKDGDNFWLKIENLVQGQEYRFQYLVDGTLRIADPYTEKMSSQFDDPQIIAENRYPNLQAYPQNFTSEAISYIQTGKAQYEWTATNYTRPAVEDLVIYELLVRDFTDERTFDAVIDRLDYLENLGINAIELMPVMEFEGNISWGYNPAFMFSVDKYYGTENKLKKLIDEAHKRDIAIILDIVLNHAFGRCPLVRLDNEGLYGSPTADNVWLNQTAKHDFNVGYDFNHESEYTKSYVDRVNKFWIEQYNIDGFRFDLSKGFTQKNTLGNTGAWGNYDASRIALLKRMADEIWEIDPTNYIILEHFADNSEEKELANYGMMLWGNMTGTYRSAAKGNPSFFNAAYHEDRGWDEPNLIAYMESHDEERLMWEVLKSSNFTVDEALERMKLNAAFFFLVPGPKMIWQFEELGYDEELNDDRLGIKPTHWEYLDVPSRKKLHDFFSSLINLKTKTDYVDKNHFTWSANDYVKWINIDHPDTKIVAYANFRKQEEEASIPFPTSGTWYNYFTGKELEIDATQNYSTNLQVGELQIYTSQPIDNYIGYNPLPNFEVIETAITTLILQPNPTNKLLTIQHPRGTEKLYLYDIAGHLLRTIEVNTDAQQFDLELDYLATGTYIIYSVSGEETLVQKFTKY